MVVITILSLSKMLLSLEGKRDFWSFWDFNEARSLIKMTSLGLEAVVWFDLEEVVRRSRWSTR